LSPETLVWLEPGAGHSCCELFGGASFSSDRHKANSQFQQLGLVETFIGADGKLHFLDQFSYLPETQFGFGAGTACPSWRRWSSRPSAAGLQNSTYPTKAFSDVRLRYSNSFATQAAYTVSRRGSITAAGTYGILRFIEAGNIESNMQTSPSLH